MGRHVGRSRACNTCKKRKLKCDETFPECYQCISAGRKCSGPLQGTLFVDMSEPVKQRVVDIKANNGEKGGRRNKLQPVLYAANGSVACANTSRDPSKELSQFNDSRLPTTYQPEKGDIFQSLYLAHFISSQDTEYQSWISKLPHILSLPNSLDRPEVYAIRATTMAFYGRLSKNEQLQLEASKWYAKGLKAQRESLPITANSRGQEPHTQGAVCSAIMFSLFESVICTDPMGWMHHYDAAGKILEIVGPENCQTGMMFMFFQTVRLSSFVIALTRDVPSTLASEPWCTIPFSVHTKSPFDRLVDLLLQLPACMPIRNTMRASREKDILESEILAQCLTNTAQHILSQIHALWENQKLEMDPDYDTRLETLSSHLSNPLTSNQPPPYTIPFLSSTNAYFASMYDAGNIIALGCLAAASWTPEVYLHQMAVHGASILNSAEYHQSQGCYNGGSFSMIFPVKLVCLLSPSESLRATAQELLLMWGRRRGLLDIVEIGVPSFMDRSHG
ncbi:hypothetical protein F5884DRAFT_778512 [Xylogone sp. PMI_703]|nr:hypothetical protein F5884DRAFT_778512 [Xylogone sp. PMI_703]